mmetsp:Transcript_47988/g.71479  ORF Transcript_47988/g.71479 Transcript_47988/m.71479 type:complete len:396 (-) Transcript_47988:200-1387(-)
MKFTTLAFSALCLVTTRAQDDFDGLPRVFDMYASVLGSTSNSANDLNIRFNKVGTVVGATAQLLDKDSYPIDAATAEWLRKSECWSVIRREDCGASCKYDFEDLIQSIGGYPSHPESDPDAPFWNEFRHVIKVQQHRLNDVQPALIMSIPDIWKDYSIAQVAEAVHNEYPGENQANLILSFIQAGTANMDRDIIPSPSRVEFIRKAVLLGHLNTWSVSVVGPHNFGVKFSGGRARPEEVAWLIKQGEIGVADGVPQDVFDDVMAMDFDSAVEFTAYPEGCPHHPSFPAMHSAASSASLWLPVVMDMTPEQLCQVRMVDWGVSYGRTVAGVHYPADNIAGLNLGAELVGKMLPKHLEEMYGSDPSAVARKIEKYRFDWGTFEQTDCYLQNRLATTS